MSSDRIFTLSNGVWTTPQGKHIPYSRETCEVVDDYCVRITKWPKNTTLDIVVFVGEDSTESDERWLFEEIYRVAKLPHEQFDLHKGRLIEKAIELAERVYSG